ncbi:MAG: SHOCT domain-containing protein [Gammaproteobacteria bacterium]
MMDMMNNGHGWGMGGGMWLFALLFWILLISGVVLIVRWLIRVTGKAPSSESPLDILKQRYARGEIDQETFERMKRLLEGGGHEK